MRHFVVKALALLMSLNWARAFKDVYAARSRGRMSGLFHPEEPFRPAWGRGQSGLSMRLHFTSDHDTIYSSYGVADANMTLDTGSVRTMLQ